MTNEKAIGMFIATAVINLSLLGGGIYLISSVLGWQVGVGAALLLMFLKGDK
jgi:hypothetical protein